MSVQLAPCLAGSCGLASSPLYWMAGFGSASSGWTFGLILGCRLAFWQAFRVHVWLTDSLAIISGLSFSYVVSSWHWNRVIWLWQSGRCAKTLLRSDPGWYLPGRDPQESIPNYSFRTSLEKVSFLFSLLFSSIGIRLENIFTKLQHLTNLLHHLSLKTRKRKFKRINHIFVPTFEPAHWTEK